MHKYSINITHPGKTRSSFHFINQRKSINEFNLEDPKSPVNVDIESFIGSNRDHGTKRVSDMNLMDTRAFCS